MEVVSARLADIREWWSSGALQVRASILPFPLAGIPFDIQTSRVRTIGRWWTVLVWRHRDILFLRRQWHWAVLPCTGIPTWSCILDVSAGLKCDNSILSVVQARGFGAEQTAHLIRALFEHTDLRSAVLAEIEQ